MQAPAMPLPAPIRVLVADDEPLFVEMVVALLDADRGIEVVGRARDGREAVDLVRRLEPHVTLMDISMPGIDGIEATRQIRTIDAGASVLVLSGANNPADVDRARKAGAAGYLTKDRIGEELIPRVRELGGR